MFILVFSIGAFDRRSLRRLSTVFIVIMSAPAPWNGQGGPRGLVARSLCAPRAQILLRVLRAQMMTVLWTPAHLDDLNFTGCDDRPAMYASRTGIGP